MINKEEIFLQLQQKTKLKEKKNKTGPDEVNFSGNTSTNIL